MKTILYILFIIAIGYNTTAQITLIPDPKFEQFLINEGIDSDGVINGQILTADALAVTKMYIHSNMVWYNPDEYIKDVTGLESFINLDSLSIQETNVGGEWDNPVNTIDISELMNLKYFYSSSNNLTYIDFSNNTLLEVVWLNNGGDVYPIDMITNIDLSNNPNVHTLRMEGATKINLKNGNNNENMHINVSCGHCWGGDYGYDPDVPTYGTVCIEVDNAELALNNQYPYSEWSIYHQFVGVTYSDNVAECVLNKPTFSQSNIKIYPNPVSDILYFDTDQHINNVILFDMLGRKIVEQNNTKNISVSDLQKGSYILKLFSDKGVQTEKIVVE